MVNYMVGNYKKGTESKDSKIQRVYFSEEALGIHEGLDFRKHPIRLQQWQSNWLWLGGWVTRVASKINMIISYHLLFVSL